MNKLGARQLTKQERHREEQRKREEARRRAARSKRITIISLIAASIIAVAALAFVVLAQRQTSATVAPVQSQAPAAAYPSIDGITCQNTEQSGMHIHAHVSIFINGSSVPIPANVGIAPNGSCLYWLHTHDASGVIHIEAPSGTAFTLKGFLDIWKSRFQELGYPSELDQSSGWQVYVNGKAFTGDFHAIPLQAHTLITLAFNSPGVPPDTSYPWNSL
jgi:hypothetical protein